MIIKDDFTIRYDEKDTSGWDDEYKEKLLDSSVIIDRSYIPKALEEDIYALEKCNEHGDWLQYNTWEEILEGDIKQMFSENRIPQWLFNQLERRYLGINN